MSLRDSIPGKVKFIFQPAEEGPPKGETGGAALMVKEGVLEEPRVEAIFGIHVMPTIEVGKIGAMRDPFGPAMIRSKSLSMGRSRMALTRIPV